MTSDASPPVVRFCYACGREATPGHQFCASCGVRLAQPVERTTASDSAGALFGLRAAALLIDVVIIWTVSGMFSYLGAHGDPDRTATRIMLLIPLLIHLVYPWIGNSYGGTPGKRAVGLRVVTSEGRHIGLVRGFGRFWMAAVSGIPLFLGYFWMLWDRERQTWHDKVIGSYVVRVRN